MSTQQYEKYYNEKGDVALLLSPNFGAGWSTWNSGDVAERMVFDKRLVEAVLEDNLALAAEIASGFDERVCVLGASDLRVAFLPPGTVFRVDEYDGSESIITFHEQDYYHA